MCVCLFVCLCVSYLILFVIINSRTSTVQSLDIFLTMFNEVVDQLIVGEDETLHAVKKFATLFIGDVVHVMDHTRDDKAVVTLDCGTLGHLKYTQTQNGAGSDTC